MRELKGRKGAHGACRQSSEQLTVIALIADVFCEVVVVGGGEVNSSEEIHGDSGNFMGYPLLCPTQTHLYQV